jgi:PAS domain S-box-containing protein
MSPVAPVLSNDVELQRLRTLYQLLLSLTRAKTLEDVYESAIASLLTSTAADRAAILMFDEAGIMRFRAWRNLSQPYRDAVTGHTPWPAGTPNAEPVSVPDVALDPNFSPYWHLLFREGIRSLAFIPLQLNAGLFGKLMIYCHEPHEWTPAELDLSRVIAHHVALVLEQKRAELAREASDQLLTTILDNSGTVISRKDVHGRYLLVNRLFQDLFHVEADVIGKTDYDIFPPEIAARFQENDRKALAAGAPISVEETVPQEDGLHTYISVKFPIQDLDGRVAGVCGIATDITDRQKLEVSHRRLAAVVESSYDAIITKDPNGIMTSWNKGAEELLGYTAAETLGRPVSMLAPENRRDEMQQILARIVRGERVEHFETKRQTKDGRILDVSLTVSPIRDREGRIVGASKILRDITQRKRAEEERKLLLAREQEARNTAELLNQVGPRLLAERDPEQLAQAVTHLAMAVVGAEFGAFFQKLVNEKGESYVVCAVSGAPPDSFPGSPLPLNTPLFWLNLDDKAIVRCADVTLDPRYNQNPPCSGMPEGHAPVRSYLAAPVVSRSGEVIGTLVFGHSTAGKFGDGHEALLHGIAAQAGIAMDNARLFEQAEWAQNELKRSNEELRRINEDLEVFAYSASHDLQEPLRTITLSSELLQRNFTKQLSGDAVNFLDGIHHAARTMANLITDLLTYTTAAKSAEGPPPLTDSEAVLQQVLRTMSSAIDRSGASVTSAGLPLVSIHETRLAQVFQNLVGNALKYRSQAAPRVFVSALEQDGWTVFSVKDNGIGIDLEYSNQIFGLFKRLHDRKEYPGSGLGLAICQRIIEQYGGRIWLDQSAVGAGSTFCFSLPVRTP